jgi:hypothetical protein
MFRNQAHKSRLFSWRVALRAEDICISDAIRKHGRDQPFELCRANDAPAMQSHRCKSNNVHHVCLRTSSAISTRHAHGGCSNDSFVNTRKRDRPHRIPFAPGRRESQRVRVSAGHEMASTAFCMVSLVAEPKDVSHWDVRCSLISQNHL